MSELNQEEVNEQMYLFVKQWLDDLPFEECKKVPVMAIGYCMARLSKQDTLLKEQEAVEPRVSTAEQRCGHCNKVIEMDGWKACPWCGKMIDWEGWWKKNGTRNQDS